MNTCGNEPCLGAHPERTGFKTRVSIRGISADKEYLSSTKLSEHIEHVHQLHGIRKDFRQVLAGGPVIGPA